VLSVDLTRAAVDARGRAWRLGRHAHARQGRVSQRVRRPSGDPRVSFDRDAEGYDDTRANE